VGLNSSLAQSAAELWLEKSEKATSRLSLVKFFDFWQKLCVLAIIMAPDVLEL